MGVYILKFFIDTANIEDIREANALGILSGVTTNPSLVAKEGVSFHDRLKEITAEVTEGSVSAEVISEDAEGMIEEGKELAAIAPNITIKVPMTLEGLKAVKALDRKSTRLNSSHVAISYAVFCLNKKTIEYIYSYNI